MTVHEMRLHPTPFEMIKDGSKTVEIRLNDEKRRSIKVGDVIEFSSRENPEDRFKTEVIGLVVFPSFQDSYAAYPPKTYGAEDASEYEFMYKYYSKEDEAMYGVLGISLKRLV